MSAGVKRFDFKNAANVGLFASLTLLAPLEELLQH